MSTKLLLNKIHSFVIVDKKKQKIKNEKYLQAKKDQDFGLKCDSKIS